jgi:hypothetical protein
VPRNGNREGRPPLGYDFSPTPRKLLEDFRSHDFEHATYVLLATLYDRADTDALIAGRECLRVKLTTLHRWSRWPEDVRSLAKQLRRLRAAKYIGYRTEGQRRTGCVYVFWLSSMSASCPHEDGSRSGFAVQRV